MFLSRNVEWRDQGNVNFDHRQDASPMGHTNFTDAVAELYTPLAHYVPSVIRLIIQHVWDRKQHSPKAETETLLNDSRWFARLVTLDQRVMDSEKEDDIPHWKDLKSQIIQRIDAAHDGTDREVDAMTDDCMAILMPQVQERFQVDYRFPEMPFHCWWYTIHHEDTLVAVHLINADMPGSPLADLPSFARDLLNAIEDARRKHATITDVECGTWLNHHPRFMSLWPEPFLNSRKAVSAAGGFGPGAWGQYLTAKGGFACRRAANLRQTRLHPYPLTEARAAVSEVEEQLKQIIETGIT